MTSERVVPGTTRSCDTHVHVYDARYPVAPTTVLRPPDAGVAEYRAFQREAGLQRVVLVQPTTYGFDNRCQLEAMAALGGFASKMGLASGPAVAALIVGDDNYGLLINVSVIALVACLIVMILPARVLDKR